MLSGEFYDDFWNFVNWPLNTDLCQVGGRGQRHLEAGALMLDIVVLPVGVRQRRRAQIGLRRVEELEGLEALHAKRQADFPSARLPG